MKTVSQHFVSSYCILLCSNIYALVLRIALDNYISPFPTPGNSKAMSEQPKRESQTSSTGSQGGVFNLSELKRQLEKRTATNQASGDPDWAPKRYIEKGKGGMATVGSGKHISMIEGIMWPSLNKPCWPPLHFFCSMAS